MNAILGARIRSLRESKVLTQKQVAEKMNCTRQKYARIERGLIDISYASITTVSKIFGITTEEITSAVNNYEQNQTMFRSNEEDKFEYINKMIDTFFAHRNLYNSVRQVDMNRKRQLTIEKIANTTREDGRIMDCGIQNIFEVARKIGYQVIRYPIGADAFLGFSLIKNGQRIIFSNSSLILSREIFSVAHEIAHQKLHLLEELTVIKDDDFNDRNEYEIEANYFAACFLMPRDKVENFIRFALEDKDISGNTDLCKPIEVKKIPEEYLDWVISNYNEKLILIKSLEAALNYIDLTVEDIKNLLENEFVDEESLEDLIERMD